MRKLICCFVVLTTLAVGAQKTKTKTDPRLNGLDAQLEQVLKDWKTAGFAVAVVEGDKIIYSKGFGLRDVEKGLPVTPNTLFAIGSVTKSFTSSLIGLLQKEGKVEYDKPAVQYLPGLHFYNNTMNNSITLRHMMSHQTGLPRHDYSWYFFTSASRDSILQRLQYQEPTAGVREKWQYNNFMFTAQGALAEKLTGKSWEANVQQKLFDPLGMKRSTLSIAELEKDKDAALGYGLRGDTALYKLPYYSIDAMAPAGSINSSVTEMAAWLITWINGGKYGGKEVLPGPYVMEAITPQAIIGGGLPTKEKPDIHFATYGFGWAMSSYRGHYRVDHGGNIDGFSASAAFYPTDSIGIVVLTNQDGSAVPSIVRNILSDRLLKLKPYSWNKDIKEAVAKAKAQQKEAAKAKVATAAKNTKPTHPLAAYEGRYYHPGYGSIRIYTRQDSLFGSFGQQQLWLAHNNYDVFNSWLLRSSEPVDTSGSSLPLQFHLGLTGEVESLTLPLEPGLQPLVFKKQPKEVDMTAADLKVYEGTYTLAGMETKVYVKGDKLHLFVPGQPEYELTAGGNHKFALKGVEGFSVQFGLDGNGKVTDVTFIQPNGNFKAQRKEK